VNSVSFLKECAKNGIGFTILPEIAVRKEMADKTIAPVRWKKGIFEVAILMVCYKERWISPKQKAFMATARAVLKNARD
jgi:DNA-binding transcriptional LysR family regulator